MMVAPARSNLATRTAISANQFWTDRNAAIRIRIAMTVTNSRWIHAAVANVLIQFQQHATTRTILAMMEEFALQIPVMFFS